MTLAWALMGLGILFLLLSGLWLIVPALYGLPWVPTREKRIRRALELAELRPGERLYDLGAGDGRVLILAAREFDANATGIEIGPLQCVVGVLRIWLNGCRHNAQIRCGNFYRSDISEADVVFVYATSSQVTRLRLLLEHVLRPDARVVSIATEFPGWQPAHVDREALVFLYHMGRI
jgi:hypothetical protein